MSKKYHSIGTWVHVAAIAATRRDAGRGTVAVRFGEYTLAEPVAGQVVGVTYLYSGRFQPGYGGEDGEQGHVSHRKGHLVYLVRLGMRAKPIHVAPGSLQTIRRAVGNPLPWTEPAIPYTMADYSKVWSETSKQ